MMADGVASDAREPEMTHVEQVLTLCIGRLEDEMWCEADALSRCGESEAALGLICSELSRNDV
jgi:hypothetical protein